MYRAVFFVFAATVLCALLATTTPAVNTTHLTSEVTSAFTYAVGLSRELCRRTLMNINIDHSLMPRARVFAAEQLHAIHHAAKALQLPYISVCRRIVTNAIKEYPLLRLAEEYLLPRPPYENLTYHAERGACVWTTISSTELPADFSPHTGTLFLLLATNICTAVLCLFIGSAIFAPLRIVWQSTKAMAQLAAKPQATWEAVLEDLGHALANLAAAVNNMLVLCTTGLVFCVANITMYAANLDLGHVLKKRLDPSVQPPLVVFKTLLDPRVPELEEKTRRLESELEEKENLRESSRVRDSARISSLLGEIEELEDANKAQKLVISGHLNMHAEIDLTRPMYKQFMEKKQRCTDLEGDYSRTVEEKKAIEKKFADELGKRSDDIWNLKNSLLAKTEECANLAKSQEYHQDRANRGDEASALQIKLRQRRIQQLEKLIALEKKALEARIKELDELVASQKTTIESLEARLKERDEFISTQKEAMQALEAQIKEQERRHAAQQKSQMAYLKRSFERERNKVVKASQHNFDARKAAEEALKVVEEARRAADDARKAEEKARKTAEADSLDHLEAYKAAEKALKASEEKCEAAEDSRKAAEEASAANLKALKAAEEALKAEEEESASLSKRLAAVPSSNDQGTQTSSPPPPPGKTPPSSTGNTPAGSPSHTPPGSPRKAPANLGTGGGHNGGLGFRPILPLKSVRRPKLNSSGSFGANKGPAIPVPDLSKFEFSFSTGAAPKTPGGDPAPSAPEPQTPPPAGPSAPAPAPAQGDDSGEPSGGSGEGEQPEAATPTPAEGSPAKPASPSGEPPEAPESASS